MFTMAKIRDGSTYLGKHLCANDYYAKGEQVEGHWIGLAAPLLGLESQTIGPKNLAFAALRNNRLPDQPDQKLTARDKENRIAFFDFQCSAQKSVSVMAVAMGDTRLYQAHDRAAAKAFGELERFAATRVRDGQAAWSNDTKLTGNLCAAAFRHDASRALDPQIHTHFVVANATWDATRGRWVALTEYEMVKAIRYAGKVYQNELAREVRQLGYGIEEVRQKGQVTDFEIKGVAPEIRQRFSKRRAEIEQGITKFIKEHGRDPSPGEIHVITTSTRSHKLAEITTAKVRDAQNRQLSPSEQQTLESLKAQAIEQTKKGVTLELGGEVPALKKAVSHLFERKSVAPAHEILAESLNTSLGQVRLEELKAALHAKESGLVALEHSPTLTAHLATAEGLHLEKKAVEFINRTQNTGTALGPTGFKPAPRLNAEQQQAVMEVLSQKDQVYALRGAAGTGKTTTLSEINRGLGAAGKGVFYSAPTAAAAKVLQSEGFANATTLTDFLQNVSARENLKGAVFIVDEASLQSNRQGSEVLRLAERNSARVIFVGDTRQHVSVEAGDFLRVMEKHSKLRSSVLSDVRRQTLPEYNQAVRAMLSGQVAAGMEQLAQLGWIKEGKADYVRAAADDYLRLTHGGKFQDRTLLVAPTWAENHRVTDEIRSRLKDRGLLGEGQTVEVTQSLKWTDAQKETPKNYELGQVVLFHQNSGKHRKGQRLEIVRVDQGKVVVQGNGGREEFLSLQAAKSFDVAQKRLIDLAPGDKLQLLANDKKHGLTNGDVLTVKKIERDGSIRCEMPPPISKKGVPSIHRQNDGEPVIPATFREFTHGYAVTSHKSEGRTADHVIVCAERLDAKAAYVGCSRGRQSCVVHTPNQEKLFEGLPRSGERKAALDLLQKQERKESPTLLARVQAWKHRAVELYEQARQKISPYFARSQRQQRQVQMQKPRQQQRDFGMEM